MRCSVESVEQYGVLSPLIARPRPEGGYEIISGHRRQHAAQLAGLDTQNMPSLSQAQRLKKLAQEGHFSYDVAFAVMGEEKKDELDKVVIKNDTLRKYFPRSYTPKQMEDTIIKLLEQWQRKQQRQNER